MRVVSITAAVNAVPRDTVPAYPGVALLLPQPGMPVTSYRGCRGSARLDGHRAGPDRRLPGQPLVLGSVCQRRPPRTQTSRALTRWPASSRLARLAFSGLGLVPPGVVIASEWRPKGTRPRPTPEEVNGYGGVARKS
jgi:hypothetical protein